MVAEVADILQFETFARKRSLPKSQRCVIPEELRLYIPCIEKGIANWKMALGKSDDPEFVSGINEASAKVFECFQAFISSGGKWRGEWPRFPIDCYRRSLAERCLDEVRWSLNKILINEFPSTMAVDRKPSDQSEVPLNIDLKKHLDTFLYLKDFVREFSKEIRRQTSLAERFKNQVTV